MRNRTILKIIPAAVLVCVLVWALFVPAFSAPVKKGDIDGDNAVTASDARLALRQSVGLENFSPRQFAAAAVTGAGAVTAADARIILRMAVGLTAYESEEEACVEAMLASMSLQEKIEQMIMPDIRYFNGQGQETLHASVAAMLKKHAFAGIILFAQNTQNAEQTLRLTQALQNANQKTGRTQLLIAVDQEGGKITRLATGTQTPGNMALGAIGDPSAAREASSIIGSELRSIGINVNFAPVMDVNNDPANPVIGVRSFSDSPALAAKLGAAYISGLQDQNVVSALKHFPGHGDTGTDSHTGLPVINKTLNELRENELVPFAAGIAEGAEMIMTAHIQFPQIEKNTYVSKSSSKKITLPATLSETIITGVLREDMRYDGIVVTDAMNMDAVSAHFDPLDAAALAVNAGVDILLMPFSTHSDRERAAADAYIDNLTRLVKSGRIQQQKVDDAVRRILRLKYEKGMFGAYSLPENAYAQARETVGSKAHHEAEWTFAKRSVTMVKNSNQALPVRAANKKIVLLAAYWDEVLSLKYGVQRAKAAGTLPANADVVFDCYADTPFETILQKCRNADYVIAVSELYRESALNPNKDAGKTYANLDRLINAVHADGGKFVLISAHLPYDAARFQAADAILLCWSDKGMSEDPSAKENGAAQYGPNIPAAVYLALSDKESPQGTLPVSIPKLTSGYTYSTEILYPFGYGLRY